MPTPVKSKIPDSKEWVKSHPKESEFLREAWKNKEPENYFLHRLAIQVKERGFLSPKQILMLDQIMLDRKNSKHIGSPGKHIRMQAFILKVWDLPTKYKKPAKVYSMRTTEGATVCYLGSIQLGEEGQGVILKAKVKAHKEYQGVKQTLVSHLKDIQRIAA